MIKFQENTQTEGREDRQKDEQTLFHRAYPATAGSPIKHGTFRNKKHAILTVLTWKLLLML